MTLYKKIIDEIAEESPSSRVWLDFMGEPMLAQWKLYYMIDYAKKKGCTNVCINSNGTLWTKELSDMMLDSNIDYISLDCDGYSKEVYEAIRRGGDRDVFYRNIEYLLREKQRRGAKTIIDIKVIDMEINHHEIDQIIQHWRSLGAWTAVRREGSWRGRIDLDHNDESQSGRIACGHGVGTIAIAWNGDVLSCAWDGDGEHVFGNIFESSVREVWAKRNREFTDLHLEHRWDELPESCRNCQDWMMIGEMRYDEHGNLRERNYSADKSIY